MSAYMLTSYDNLHDAMALLWGVLDQIADSDPLHRRVLSAITYLREQAYDTLPWPGDVLPNKTWDGKRV
jgi:hypothetical protein